MPLFRRALLPTSTFILVGVLGSACAGGQSSTDKQLGALREELTMTQAALDRAEERLVALELSSKAPSHATPANEPARMVRPPLKVVRMEPEAAAAAVPEAPPAEASEPSAAAGAPLEADGERPVIRGEGSDLESSLDPPRAKKSKTTHPGKDRQPAVRPE